MNRSKSCRKKKANDTVPCSVAIPRDLQSAIIRVAEAEDRSFSAVVRRAVVAYLGADCPK